MYEQNMMDKSSHSSLIMIIALIAILFLIALFSKKHKNSWFGKIFDKNRAPSLIEYSLGGWMVCFFAGIFLFKHMFGSWTEPDSAKDLAFYGFISLVPGVIIGALFYLAKKSDYDKKHKNSDMQYFASKDMLNDKVLGKDSQDTIQCPYCGEEILAVAKKCKHCGEWLDKKQ
ncbi:MAG: zinc ribbon domain-containing protein [Muribaculaceae bacterium]|nr:zinc ribbon domain-containing protein [Muribaculaceae bacterium]